jgi:excinuclease ABC subunit C
LDIKGIGKKAAEALLKEIKSLEKIKNSPVEDLAKVVGESKAKLIYNFYHKFPK